MDNIELVYSSWNDIDIELYLELYSIDKEEYNSSMGYKLEQLCILTETNSDDIIWTEMNIDDIYIHFDKIKWINKQPRNNYKNELIVNDVIYKLKNINDLTLGEYIDLDTYFKEDIQKNIDKIVAVLYRKVGKDLYNNEILEPYTFNLESRRLEFHSINIQDIFGIIQEFNTFKNMIENNYNNVFLTLTDEEDLEYEKTMDSIEKKIYLEEKQEEEKSKEWGWIDLVYEMANHNILEMSNILNSPAIFIFNMIAYKKTFKK